jgi:hypothetical protein
VRKGTLLAVLPRRRTCYLGVRLWLRRRTSDPSICRSGAIHDESRPLPPVVDPGPAPAPAPVPSDAIVLFDGSDLSGWTTTKGARRGGRCATATWKWSRGPARSRPPAAFGDCQLHVEWASPGGAYREGQDRGNSGVFLMERYEVQVLDSYDSRPTPTAWPAAIYGQYPPLVNASRKPGEWQTYDIVFRAPRFDADGALVSPRA